MNDHEIDRLADAMNVARPDWPVKSLRTFIAAKLAHRPYRDVFVALAWIACEANTATPARVLESGPWWKAAAIEGTTSHFQPLKPEERCKTCGKAEADCRRNPWGDHAFEVDVFRPRTTDVTPVIAELKGHLEPIRERPEPPAPQHTDHGDAALALHETEDAARVASQAGGAGDE